MLRRAWVSLGRSNEAASALPVVGAVGPGFGKSNGDAQRLLRLSESGMKAGRETEGGDGGQHPNNPAKATRHWRSSYIRNTVEGRDAAGYGIVSRRSRRPQAEIAL